MTAVWPWLAVVLLGTYHGIDPSMGWLFAVGLGLQEQKGSKVLAALPPIALGHLLSVGLTVAVVVWAQAAGIAYIRPLGGATLIGFGLFRLWRPRAHPRWVAMRVNSLDLTVWSFLMASAHGAGLMLFPILIEMPTGVVPMHHRMSGMSTGGHISVMQAVAVVVVHTTAMLMVMGTVAVAVYRWIGLKILRTAWINLETIWAVALIGAGALSLML